MQRISQQFALAFVISLASIQSFSLPVSKTLYGLDGTQHFQSKTNDGFYIQLGIFKNHANADKFLKSMQLKTNYPIAEHQKNGAYAVMLGPMHSAAEVRVVSRELSASLTTRKHENRYAPTHRMQRQPMHPWGFDENVMVVPGSWYVAGDIGGQSARVDNRLTVNNSSGFPAPFNVDSYSTNTKSAAIAGFEGGYRWTRSSQWLPALALGLRYQHFFASNVGSQITQYSLPDFTNYNYNWNVSSDVLMIATKLNLIQFNQISPYVTGGVGVAFNRGANYSETALENVTPRVSPAFDNHTNTKFTYSVGAGLDWQVSPKLILSLGYQFQDLGSVSSGTGTGLWAGDALRSGSYRSSSVLFSTSYLIGK